MARPLHDGSSSEPVGSIQVEASRVFPSGVGISCAICEQNRAASTQSTPDVHPQPASCQRCTSPRVNHYLASHEVESNCESAPSSSNCGQRFCLFPASFTPSDHPVYRHIGGKLDAHVNQKVGWEVGREGNVTVHFMDQSTDKRDGHVGHGYLHADLNWWRRFVLEDPAVPGVDPKGVLPLRTTSRGLNMVPVIPGGVEAIVPMDEARLADDGHIEREIAMRLRRIGDEMNELYLQRWVAGERRWWRPLRWHLTQFISEVLTALYNPLIDILPHN
ncbi:uncharacterized protein RCH25_043078 [Pelodytes ibericus]